jgi:MATE family multidrug resistance protein
MPTVTIDSSPRSILRVTLPMILSAMSSHLMHLVDRCMLAGYSIDAMTAAVISGHFVGAFTFMLVGLAGSAEVFVGQYNGIGKYEKLATPTWQMIYMALLAWVPCAIIAYFSENLNVYPPYYAKDGIAYQKILMYSAVFPPIKVALASFFIGQGKAKIITLSVAIGVLSNIALDYFLIYVANCGCSGAAIATAISEFIQVVILSLVFFSESNRRRYKTFQNRAFNRSLFRKCLKIGFPISFGNFAMLFAWYVLQTIVSYTSKDEATVFGICTSLYIFFVFIAEGVNKGIAAITSNMISRGDLKSIEETRKFFSAIALFFGAIIAIPLVLFPDAIIGLLSIVPGDISRLYGEIKIVLMLLAINVTAETLLHSTWGILIAGGDSKYTIILEQICFWALVVCPIIALRCAGAQISVPLIYTLTGIWLVVNQILLLRRYKSLKWCNRLV